MPRGGRGLTSRAGAGLRVHAGEERPPKEANRLLGQLDALAAAGGEAFIAPGGGALAQSSRRTRLLSPSAGTSRRGGAHCGSAPRTPAVCPPPGARPGSSPHPTRLPSAQPGARSHVLPAVCTGNILLPPFRPCPPLQPAPGRKCTRPASESGGRAKGFVFESYPASHPLHRRYPSFWVYQGALSHSAAPRLPV